MKIVIKIGGAALEDKADAAEMRASGCATLEGWTSGRRRAWRRQCAHPHPEAPRKESDFIHGLRVTDAETRDVALMVLAGIVNKSLVAAIAAAGYPAIGLCGGDGGVFRARKKQDAEHDLGFVGEICFSEPRWLRAIWARRRYSGALFGGARRRRRVLQRERRSDGCGMRDRLRSRCADFSYRRCRA